MSIMEGQKDLNLHALVLGASGISGWALLKQLVEYPTKESWSRISGTTYRPFDAVNSGLPLDERLRVSSGIDLTRSVDTIAQSLKEKIDKIETVTHVFYTAYIAKDTRLELKKINTSMLENTMLALNQVAPLVKVVILQTGGKGYGLEFPNQVNIVPPLREDLPRIEEPMGDEIFYYSQVDVLHRLSKQSKWTFAEARPDGIIGYVPGSNPMNMAQGIALYLSIWREVYGKGAEVPYPGSLKAYFTKHSDTFQDLLARAEIFVALSDKAPKGGAAYNVADEDEPIVWANKWPEICRQFGLVGVAPKDDGAGQSMEEFVKEHRSEWSSICKAHSLREEMIDVQGWAHTHFMLVDFDFDRHYDLSKLRRVGFTEAINSVQGYRVAFERMAAAGIIPKDYLE